MKRIIVLLVTLFSCLSISAQIQTKFWGLELCKNYNSIEEAQTIIQSRCKKTTIEGNTLWAYTGTLGGYEWKFIEFYFLEEKVSYRLCSADFSYNYNSKDDAKSRYNSLKESLERKYGVQHSTPTDIGEMTIWTDETSNCCILSLEQDTARNGMLFWYVNLTYQNDDLLERAIQKEEDEL